MAKFASDTALGDAPPTCRKRVYARKDDVVLEAADKAFLQAGFGNTSMDAIAELAGVSKRTVYSNFGSKQDLFAAVIRRRCAEVLPNDEHLIDADERDPEAVLIGLATAFLTSIFSASQIELYQTLISESRASPEIGKIMFEGPIMRSQEIFDRYLRAQAKAGRLTFPDIDLAAGQLIALLKTNLHMRLLFNQPTNLTTAEIARSTQASVSLFLNGARLRT